MAKESVSSSHNRALKQDVILPSKVLLRALDSDGRAGQAYQHQLLHYFQSG